MTDDVESAVEDVHGDAVQPEQADKRPNRLLSVLSAVAFTAGASAVVVHVVGKHQRARDARETIAKLQAGLDALRPNGYAELHATVNGVQSHVAFSSLPQGVAAAASAVADSCGNDAETGSGSVQWTGDTPPRPRFVRETVHRDEAADGSAVSVMCIFRSAETGERFERFTFVRGDAKASSLTSVTRQSAADLAQAFPIEGDAPGDDLVGVPRPESSRRVISATVAETGHAVRIYEVARKGTPDEAIRARREAFDRQMRGAGYEPSAAVAQALPDTQLYVRGKERIVVAFEPSGDVTRIVINRTDLL